MFTGAASTTSIPASATIASHSGRGARRWFVYSCSSSYSGTNRSFSR
jgi:hypothetical protein